MKIYVGQTKLIINVDCGVDITGSVTTLIKYKKPNGAEGQFTATVIDAAKGKMQYVVASANDLDVNGQWKVWAHITFADSKVAIGEAAIMNVYKQGQ